MRTVNEVWNQRDDEEMNPREAGGGVSDAVWTCEHDSPQRARASINMRRDDEYKQESQFHFFCVQRNLLIGPFHLSATVRESKQYNWNHHQQIQRNPKHRMFFPTTWWQNIFIIFINLQVFCRIMVNYLVYETSEKLTHTHIHIYFFNLCVSVKFNETDFKRGINPVCQMFRYKSFKSSRPNRWHHHDIIRVQAEYYQQWLVLWVQSGLMTHFLFTADAEPE